MGKARTKDVALALLPNSLQGGLWVGFFQDGLAYFKDGQVRASYQVTDGSGGGRVASLQLDHEGTLWAATEGGLSRVKNGRVATLSSKNSLPCDAVHWVMEDDAHGFWLYMACGLVRIARPELDAWVADPKRTIRAAVFDGSDGVKSHAALGGYRPHVAKTADGKLWFLPWDGVSVVDPLHIPFNKLPPPAKHAQAKQVEVRLPRADSLVCLVVSDDGVGFNPDGSGKSGGLGLINMRQRARQLNGTFEFESKPGHGTTVKAEVPFRPAP